jgi:hypothetical protein
LDSGSGSGSDSDEDGDDDDTHAAAGPGAGPEAAVSEAEVVAVCSSLRRVRVHVMLDLSSLPPSAFWEVMARFSMCYPRVLGRPVCPFTLPRAVSGIVDDPYRTLAWLVRRVQQAPLAPGYLKVPTGFIEFLWADHMRRWLRAREDPPAGALIAAAVAGLLNAALADAAAASGTESVADADALATARTAAFKAAAAAAGRAAAAAHHGGHGDGSGSAGADSGALNAHALAGVAALLSGTAVPRESVGAACCALLRSAAAAAAAVEAAAPGLGGREGLGALYDYSPLAAAGGRAARSRRPLAASTAGAGTGARKPGKDGPVHPAVWFASILCRVPHAGALPGHAKPAEPVTPAAWEAHARRARRAAAAAVAADAEAGLAEAGARGPAVVAAALELAAALTADADTAQSADEGVDSTSGELPHDVRIQLTVQIALRTLLRARGLLFKILNAAARDSDTSSAELTAYPRAAL